MVFSVTNTVLLVLAPPGALNVTMLHYGPGTLCQFSLSPGHSVTTATQVDYYIINATESSSHKSGNK